MQTKVIERLNSVLNDLPTLPSIVLQINNILKDDLIPTHEINKIIERDPTLTSKVLRLANSSYYGLSYHVNTVARAVTVLGINTIRNLSVTASVFEIFSGKINSPFDAVGLWYHSLGTAIAAKVLIGKTRAYLDEEAFACGILHDIGKIIIAQEFPDSIQRVLKETEDNVTLTQSEVEKGIIGYTHSEVGALVAEKWHFPKELSEIIRCHHNYSFNDSSVPPTDIDMLLCSVYAGNQIAKGIALGKSTNERVDVIEPSAWTLLEISEKEFQEVLFQIKMDFESVLEAWNLE